MFRTRTPISLGHACVAARPALRRGTAAPALRLAAPLLAAALSAAPAWAQGGDPAAGFRFQIGLTAFSGMNEFGDKIVANNPNVDVTQSVPLGLALAALYQFGNGFAVGATLGPAILAVGDVSLHVVPVGLEGRYRFSSGPSSPYVRLGVEKASAGGDFVKTGKAGAAVAVGMDFGKPAGFGWGFEVGYRSVEVIIKATPGRREATAQPYKGTLSGYVAF